MSAKPPHMRRDGVAAKYGFREIPTNGATVGWHKPQTHIPLQVCATNV